MKKIAIYALIFILSASCLVGCRNKKPSDTTASTAPMDTILPTATAPTTMPTTMPTTVPTVPETTNGMDTTDVTGDINGTDATGNTDTTGKIRRRHR